MGFTWSRLEAGVKMMRSRDLGIPKLSLSTGLAAMGRAAGRGTHGSLAKLLVLSPRRRKEREGVKGGWSLRLPVNKEGEPLMEAVK